MEKILLKNGRIMAGMPPREIHGDILIADGKIEKIGKAVYSTRSQIIDADNKLILPGLIDTHTHYLNSTVGHKMLVAAGVTTALDALIGAGEITRMNDFFNSHPVGINSLYLFLLRPGFNLSSVNPAESELRKEIEFGISHGAWGVKIIGGHMPFTPEATAKAIAIASEMKVPLMLHAGTTENPDNFNGFMEAVELAEGNPFHLAHINSYCTGEVLGNACKEAEAAIRQLRSNPGIISESSLSKFSCIGSRMVDGVPESLSMQHKLKALGYQATYEGLEKSIADQVTKVSGQVGDEYILLDNTAGLELFKQKAGQVTIAFPARHSEANMKIATAKRDNGEFVVNALATDGGVIPRNFTLKEGLQAVKTGDFSLTDFMIKASYNPAKMLGLEDRKGHLSEGADADLIIVDEAEGKPDIVICSGNIIYKEERFSVFSNKLFSLEGGRYYGLYATGTRPKWTGRK